MLDIIFLVSFLGRVYSQEELTDAFWVVIGHPDECFNLPYHRSIEWMPDIIGVYMKIDYMGSTRKTRTLENTIYARRSVTLCQKDLKVPYFDIMGIDTVKIEIHTFWEKFITIDQTTWTLHLSNVRDEENFKWINGERNTLFFRLDFSQKMEDFPKYSNVKFLWSEVINEINIDEPICMRVWDHPGIYNLFPDVKLQYLPQLYKNSYMVVSAYSDQNMQQIVHQESHLVHIYQCKDLNKKPLKIAVGDSVNSVSLTFMERESCNSQGINFIKENGIFIKKFNHLDLDSMLNVIINTQDFKTAWKDRKNIYFLHGKKPKTKRCADEHGFDIKDVKLEMVENDGAIYVLNSLALTLQKYFNILHWRMATPEEEDWCKSFKYS